MTHDIVVIVVQVISVGLTYYFGRRSAISDLKTTALKTRYETAYVPYVKVLYHGLMIDDVNQDASFETRGKFFDILSQNLESWDPETLRLYPAFYKAFLDMLEYEDGNADFTNAPKEFRQAFRDITLSILESTQSIARELSMPPLGAALYENYRRSGQTQQSPQESIAD